ncbi:MULTISPECIES: FitA-like ribbon-helix-helix domain-containing protein [Nocardia]|uniref:FitA-like ribbon-helix-helix domain-containing protein n=1 Tax=Nocardia TaxID=1817 RepID=UPI001895E7BD|nr:MULTISPECIES: Arc family DNA-binding protein [Nocardia]MBF6179331.1 Arc family DNA-binding protein [Nocardia otitidiscaviarum]
MKNVTIRNLSDEVHRAIRQRAATHGRSVEAEMRAILAEAVQPPERIKLGSMLAEIGRELALTDEEHALLDNRDRTPAEPLEFD